MLQSSIHDGTFGQEGGGSVRDWGGSLPERNITILLSAGKDGGGQALGPVVMGAIELEYRSALLTCRIIISCVYAVLICLHGWHKQ